VVVTHSAIMRYCGICTHCALGVIPDAPFQKEVSMKISALACAAILGLALTGTAMAQGTKPSDTGSMAFPAPAPQGNLETTRTGPGRGPTDTGNMAYPAPAPQGNVGTTSNGRGRGAPDTGSMAFPAPLPQGNVATTPRK
jgi:hypothetical protein